MSLSERHAGIWYLSEVRTESVRMAELEYIMTGRPHGCYMKCLSANTGLL